MDYLPIMVPKSAVPAQAPSPANWFQRLASGLKRSSGLQLTGGIAAVFTKKKLDQAMLDELEDISIQADFGVDMADRRHRSAAPRPLRPRHQGRRGPRHPRRPKSKRSLAPVAQAARSIDTAQSRYVILMVGVNGSGKTTTIGKLARSVRRAGQVGDARGRRHVPRRGHRAAPGLGQRTGAPVVARPAGSDASAWPSRRSPRRKPPARDVLIIDTAGRLQNRDELMSELEKIIRVIKKVDPTAPHATLADPRCDHWTERPQSGRNLRPARGRHAGW